MYQIIFICYGNICRSPMAEMIFKDLIYQNNKRYKFSCISRATSIEELGNPLYPEAAKILKENGIHLESHRAKQITKEECEKYDYIIVMEKRNKKDLLNLVGESIENKVHLLMEFTEEEKGIAIEDPWYTGDFKAAYQDIYKGCIGLYNYLLEKGEDYEI